jgi:dTMP kinase
MSRVLGLRGRDRGGRGLLITFEGIDGCGKSTQVARAKEALVKKDVPCIVSREPGGTAISEKIRDILLSPQHAEMCDACELLLYMAARAQHVQQTIVPAMEGGAVVLCDRFAEATFAYQGFGRGLPLDLLEKINSFATASLRPSFTFVFDIPVATACERLRKTGKTADRLEGCGGEFYEKVRKGYLSLAQKYSKRIMVLDGQVPVEELSAIISEKVLELYRQI